MFKIISKILFDVFILVIGAYDFYMIFININQSNTPMNVALGTLYCVSLLLYFIFDGIKIANTIKRYKAIKEWKKGREKGNE